jgi:hypothetical protein
MLDQNKLVHDIGYGIAFIPPKIPVVFSRDTLRQNTAEQRKLLYEAMCQNWINMLKDYYTEAIVEVEKIFTETV